MEPPNMNDYLTILQQTIAGSQRPTTTPAPQGGGRSAAALMPLMMLVQAQRANTLPSVPRSPSLRPEDIQSIAQMQATQQATQQRGIRDAIAAGVSQRQAALAERRMALEEQRAERDAGEPSWADKTKIEMIGRMLSGNFAARQNASIAVEKESAIRKLPPTDSTKAYTKYMEHLAESGGHGGSGAMPWAPFMSPQGIPVMGNKETGKWEWGEVPGQKSTGWLDTLANTLKGAATYQKAYSQGVKAGGGGKGGGDDLAMLKALMDSPDPDVAASAAAELQKRIGIGAGTDRRTVEDLFK